MANRSLLQAWRGPTQVCLASAEFSLVKLSADDVCEAIRAIFFVLCFLLSPPSQPTFSCAINRAVLDIIMSFGFSVGDFIAAIELANKIRKEFVDAPSQFKDISDEYVIEVCL
jgi:hypothetical protein